MLKIRSGINCFKKIAKDMNHICTMNLFFNLAQFVLMGSKPSSVIVKLGEEGL